MKAHDADRARTAMLDHVEQWARLNPESRISRRRADRGRASGAEHGVAERQRAVRRQLERDLGPPRPSDRVRAHTALERLAAAERPKIVTSCRSRQRRHRSSAPRTWKGVMTRMRTRPRTISSSAVSSGSLSARASGSTRDRVVAVAQRARRHGRRQALPEDEPPESRGDLVERGHRHP
jgi:hypothetical protein